MTLLELKTIEHGLELRQRRGQRCRTSNECDFHHAATSEHARVVIDNWLAFACCPDGPFEVVGGLVITGWCFPAENRHGGPATLEAFLVTCFGALLYRIEQRRRIERILFVVLYVADVVEFKNGKPVFTGGRDKTHLFAGERVVVCFHDHPRVTGSDK